MFLRIFQLNSFWSWFLYIFFCHYRNFSCISRRIFIKCLFYPFFFVRICSCCYNVLFFTCYCSLYIFTNISATVVNMIPILKVLILNTFLFWPKHYSHFMFWTFIASSSWHSRFSEVHYVKCIKLSFFSSFYSKIEPLLMTPSISIDLHK